MSAALLLTVRVVVSCVTPPIVTRILHVPAGLVPKNRLSTWLLDVPLDQRRDEFARLRALAGRCRADGEIVAENWLRGRFDLVCERRPLRVTFTLAPTRPALVQHLSVTENIPPPRPKCGP